MALRLIITQGPRRGETLEFPPGSTVRVGRVVRGNNLTIKESGISTKHLCIVSESSKWLLQDLDSSNGTFVNGQMVEPNAALEIRSGDVVKLGEVTSISVQIDAGEAGSLRRNPKREVSAAPEVPADEVAVLRRGPGRRAKVSSSIVEEEGSAEVPVIVVKSTARKQIGRSKQLRDEELPVVARVEVDPVPVKRASARRNRSAKNDENLVSYSVPEIILEDHEFGDEDENAAIPKKTRGRPRRKNLHQKLQDCLLIDIPEERVAEDDVQVGTVATDRTEMENENENTCGVAESSYAVEKAGVSGSKERPDEVGTKLDLEKMTLGEWFDCLEIDLRKQIVEATEEMIKGMSLKAKRVREYMVEQKNAKAKVSVV